MTEQSFNKEMDRIAQILKDGNFLTYEDLELLQQLKKESKKWNQQNQSI